MHARLVHPQYERSFKARVVRLFLLHFFIFLSTRDTVRSNSSLLEHNNKTRSRKSERERGPFPYQRRGRCKRRRTETLSSHSFRRVLVLGFERRRGGFKWLATHRDQSPNDGAAPLPIVATTTTTETDGGVDRSVHPSGIVPTLQCVFVLLFFCCVFFERDKDDEIVAVLDSIPIVAAF